MKKNIYLLAIVFIAMLIGSCKTDYDALTIQKAYTYSEKYYSDLRAYKAMKHPICFGWYAAYDTDASPSFGNHFSSLPDSMDIVSLWKAIPSDNPEIKEGDFYNRKYLPVAYKEMREIQKLKGTKIVMCKIVRIAGTTFTKDDAGIRNYAEWCAKLVLDNNLDGFDMDYEPEGDWLQNDNFTKFVQILGEYIGPKSANPDKLLICDFYSQVPPAATEPYINYFIRQAYAAASATTLQTQYNSIKTWCAPEKYIVTEQMGMYWMNGGVAFTEVNGNKLDDSGKQLYSLLGMARWNPVEGRKGGFGGFYFEYEYNLDPPYKSMRAGIQAQNPSVK